MEGILTGSKGTYTPITTEGKNIFYLQPQKLNQMESNLNLGIHKGVLNLQPEQDGNAYNNSPTYYENVRSYFRQYCGVTSIHGIQYIGERGRLIVEKIIWTTIMAVLCSFCLFFITKTYQKWGRSPVLVSFAPTETGIWKIPFPAVTICPEIKSDPEIFNFTGVLFKSFRGNITKSEERYLEAFSLVCSEFSKLMREKVFPGMNFTTKGPIFSELIEALPDFNPQNVSDINWLGKPYKWDDMLSFSITSEGLCYSFNMLNYDEILKDSEKKLPNQFLPKFNQKKWSLENGYTNDDEEDSFPRRTFLSGFNGGFVYDGLYANHSHLDYVCTQGVQGFKVALHHPSELPDMDKHFRVPLDQSVIVAIKPRMIYVGEELKSYNPEDRKCYFANERFLLYFRSYSQHNCLNECFWNYTLSNCKCLAFYMQGFSDTTPICGLSSWKCLEKSKVQYLSNQKSGCKCLPLCTELQYDVEITQSTYEWYEVLRVMYRFGMKEEDLNLAYKNTHLSKLTVFYKDLQFLASERHELYGYTDFFSNVGGLLGLFMGFSVTSMIEIVYFLSLRIACNVMKFGRNFWSGDPELTRSTKKES